MVLLARQSNFQMELRLVNSHENEKLAYYKNGDIQVNGDDFVLLGFKNLKAVLDIPDKMKPENNLTSITKKTVPKMQLDAAGEKFIHLNGRKLKVVSQNQIPEEICKRTILLKNKMVNLGNTKNPVKLCVISSATQLAGNKADMKDKPVSNILIDKLQCTTPKKLRLISIKNIIKPVHCDPPSQSENSNGIIDSVNPKNILSDSQGLPEQIDSFLISNTSAKGTTKLLTSKNIDILNKVKMQALNLSKKTKVVDSAVQTDPQSVMDQNIQTDPSHDSLDSLQVLCNWIEFGDSPVLNNVNLNMSNNDSTSVLTESMSYKVKTMPDSADRTLKKQRFFKDLNECLKPSLNGNLPIHEGVIDNNISLVKRMCMALKARGVGINEENNNGCTPLQLGIINNCQPEIVKVLLDNNADILEVDGEGNNVLHLAAKFERIEILKIIINHQVFRQNFQIINSFNFDGLTPLMLCCMSKWYEGASLFINEGADVNLKDQTSGRTSLFHAAEAHCDEIVKILLDNRADPKIKNFFGTSPHDAMYELDEMPDIIKNLIFGKTKKRTFEAEMNPVRTAKAARNLKTYSKLQRIELKNNVHPVSVPLRYPISEVK